MGDIFFRSGRSHELAGGNKGEVRGEKLGLPISALLFLFRLASLKYSCFIYTNFTSGNWFMTRPEQPSCPMDITCWHGRRLFFHLSHSLFSLFLSSSSSCSFFLFLVFFFLLHLVLLPSPSFSHSSYSSFSFLSFLPSSSSSSSFSFSLFILLLLLLLLRLLLLLLCLSFSNVILTHQVCVFRYNERNISWV